MVVAQTKYTNAIVQELEISMLDTGGAMSHRETDCVAVGGQQALD